MATNLTAMDRLVSALDALGAKPTMQAISARVQQHSMSPDDVARFVHEDQKRYYRWRVAIRPGYEVLVMTWRPGQASVPHDHAGSTCVLQIVQGRATERTYRLAGDGYVDETSCVHLEPGAVVAGNDSAIHSVHNDDASGRTMVSVHIYSPPLGEFKKFVARPADSIPARVNVDVRDRVPSVCIVGGGFSGTMTAVNLLRNATQSFTPIRVVLLERRGALGEGVAYGTADDSHLLNVPAGRMSALPDQPDHFLNFARRHLPRATGADYLPRRFYGSYVRETLAHSALEAGDPGSLSLVFDDARRVLPNSSGGWLVHCAASPTIRADAVVLAMGHRPPSDPLATLWSGSRTRWISDPWKPFAASDVQPDEPLVLLGSGLTAVDVVLSAAGLTDDDGRPQRTAPIWLVSRRGLLPSTHSSVPTVAANLSESVARVLGERDGVTARSLTRHVREWIAQVGTENWRSVVDGLRPHTPEIWHAMNPRERKRFADRVRPFWEVHRHRMAPTIAARLRSLMDRGVVRLLAGRVENVVADDSCARVYVAQRAKAASPASIQRLDAAWVFNCTGPTPSNKHDASPIVSSLLSQGLVIADELGLGIQTTSAGACVDARGQAAESLMVVGTLRKPDQWESTAVPELRVQASQVAASLLEYIRSRLLGQVEVRPLGHASARKA